MESRLPSVDWVQGGRLLWSEGGIRAGVLRVGSAVAGCSSC